MPEPVSAVVAGYALAFCIANRPTSAVSPEAHVLRQRIRAVADSAERSVTLFGAKAGAISELWSLVKEHSQNDWDGEGATAISLDAAAAVDSIIRTLPDDVPMPEFAAEPDGSISVDWIYSRTRFLSIGVGTGDRLPFAWIDGTDSGHGVARFFGDRIPSVLLDLIRETMISEDAAIGIA